MLFPVVKLDQEVGTGDANVIREIDFEPRVHAQAAIGRVQLHRRGRRLLVDAHPGRAHQRGSRHDEHEIDRALLAGAQQAQDHVVPVFLRVRKDQRARLAANLRPQVEGRQHGAVA